MRILIAQALTVRDAASPARTQMAALLPCGPRGSTALFPGALFSDCAALCSLRLAFATSATWLFLSPADSCLWPCAHLSTGLCMVFFPQLVQVCAHTSPPGGGWSWPSC